VEPGDATWCFPGRLDDAVALEAAVAANPRDAVAWKLLGHWRYGVGRAADALAAWRTSAELDPADPVVWRNIGLSSYNHLGDPAAARSAYDRALAVAGPDAKLLVESDRLDARLGVPPGDRLARLLKDRELVETRDDATIVLADLLLTADRTDEARELLLGRAFQPWEGGEGEVLRVWDRLCRRVGDPAAALDPPASLGEARHPLASTAALHLLLGDVRAETGDRSGAAEAWERAAADRGDFLAMSAQPHSEATSSTVLALRRLGRDAEAAELTGSLREFVDELAASPAGVDYFATSLPSMLLFTEDPEETQARRVLFLRAQLDVLDGAPERARERLDALLAQDPHHTDALDLHVELPARDPLEVQ
jgi:tetratricopeptide (TPR) repeat protein